MPPPELEGNCKFSGNKPIIHQYTPTLANHEVTERDGNISDGEGRQQHHHC
jgi:hypothetical protein